MSDYESLNKKLRFTDAGSKSTLVVGMIYEKYGKV